MLTWVRDLHAQQATPPDLIVFLALCVTAFLLATWASHTIIVAVL
jgi:hypothetical protein